MGFIKICRIKGVKGVIIIYVNIVLWLHIVYIRL